MKIGLAELIIIFIVALVVVGPDKLPFYARKLGEALAQFRKYSEEATKDIKKTIVEPLNEAQKPLKEALQPIEDLDKSLRGNITDVKKSFSDIGKEKKEAEIKKDTEPVTDAAAEPEKLPLSEKQEEPSTAEEISITQEGNV